MLVINGGSSSIKFAVYETGKSLERGLSGQMGRIGLSDTRLTFTDPAMNQSGGCPIDYADYSGAVRFLVEWLEKQRGFDAIKMVGHRVVYGMEHTDPERITPALREELRRISAFDPDHLPGEIELIDAFQKRQPNLAQITCFDTAFHRTMPRVAQLLPIPRRFDAKGAVGTGFTASPTPIYWKNSPEKLEVKLRMAGSFWPIWAVGQVWPPSGTAKAGIPAWALPPPPRIPKAYAER